jgi:hypothetical protein
LDSHWSEDEHADPELLKRSPSSEHEARRSKGKSETHIHVMALP